MFSRDAGSVLERLSPALTVAYIHLKGGAPYRFTARRRNVTDQPVLETDVGTPTQPFFAYHEGGLL
jgi:hypothetical protein